MSSSRHRPTVVGIAMVRNEADIIRVNILHHLSHCVDRMIVVDNGSTDGTDRILEEMSRTGRVMWTRDDSPYQQSRVITRLARQAYHEGADWVLPIDADEFWYARHGDFKGVLARSEAVAISAQVVTFVQRRSQQESTPEGLLHMTWRPATPVGPVERVPELVEARQISLSEAAGHAKWISRPTADIEIWAGNHHLSGIVGGLESTEEIVCLHAPIRSRAGLDAKADHGRRVEEAGFKGGDAFHVRRFRRLRDEQQLDLEWAANSYRDGCLDVYGSLHPLVFDPTLRNLLMPYIGPAPLRLLATLRRSLPRLRRG